MDCDKIFVGDGLLFDGESLWEMSAVGAFNSFFAPSTGFLGFLSGDDDDEDVLGGRVFILRGTKALRTSSIADSLPDSLGLCGDLDGLFGMTIGGIADAVALFVYAMYSAGYLWSSEYGARVCEKLGLNRSADGTGNVPDEKQRESVNLGRLFARVYVVASRIVVLTTEGTYAVAERRDG